MGFLGDDIPGFDEDLLCPPPEQLTAEETAIFSALGQMGLREYKTKLLRWLADKKKRITDLEDRVDTLETKADQAKAALQNHEARISTLEGM